MEVLIIIVTLFFSAFFSGSEIAFVAANRLHVEVKARNWQFVGPIVQQFIQNPRLFLTTTLVGNNLALVVYSTLMAIYLEPPLQGAFASIFPEAAADAFDIPVLIIQTIIASVLVLVFGEIIPKSIFRETANRSIFFLALPLQLSYIVLFPLIKVAAWTANGLVNLFGASGDTFTQFLRRDFELIIEEGKQSGMLDLDEEESVLVSNVLAMGSTRVKESMVPRTNIEAIAETATLEEFRALCVDNGHSKLPVYRDNIDHIVGIAFAYDFFNDPTTLADVIRPVQFVPESKLSKDLLREFLATNTSIAIVIDEYGGTAGLVTLEDLLEELFGDIQDEFDTDDAEIRRIGEHTFVCSGRADLDELNGYLDIPIPDGDYETVAGYLLASLGTIPKPKEEFTLDGYRFVIMQATANRIDLVKVMGKHKPVF